MQKAPGHQPRLRDGEPGDTDGAIHDAMLPAHAESANAMDVEFAFLPDRRFVMLQARPYKIVYSLDRTRVKRHETLADRVAEKVRILLYRLTGGRW